MQFRLPIRHSSIVSQVLSPSSHYDDSHIQLTTSHYDRRTLIITRFQHVAPHSNERHLSGVHPLSPSIYSVVSVGFKSSSQQDDV
jgi:hypothetical protein